MNEVTRHSRALAIAGAVLVAGILGFALARFTLSPSAPPVTSAPPATNDQLMIPESSLTTMDIGVEAVQLRFRFSNLGQRAFPSLLRVDQLLLDRVPPLRQGFADLASQDEYHHADKDKQVEKLPGFETWIVKPRG